MIRTFDTERQITLNSNEYTIYNINKTGLNGVEKLPNSLKVLLENLLRHEDGETVAPDQIHAFADWLNQGGKTEQDIAYHPARVLMQDFTGVPAVADLAALRDAMQTLGGDPKQINPLCPVDLVIDHSVQVDNWTSSNALYTNTSLEMQRNMERYRFLRWGQQAFKNFRAVPPGTGICHQVNLEYLANVVWHTEKDGKIIAYPDTLVGTDSHTTMVNGLGVLGWGVGGIEAEAAMLGQAVSMRIPEVIGFRFEGKLAEGITATDLVLTVVEMLRTKGVVGKFVEFYGPGLGHLPLADRATIANMAPEYGATCGFFPVDKETIRYLRLTGRSEDTITLVEAYAKAQGLWHDQSSVEPVFTDTLLLDLATVRPSVAGPKRPQDRVLLTDLRETTEKIIEKQGKIKPPDVNTAVTNRKLQHGDVVIAAITSCTNTSNPSVMLAAGLLAKKACALGLKAKPWVKCSLAPGSQVVSDYLKKVDLFNALESVGFFLVGYGCTTCIGNSGPLSDEISQVITENELGVNAVLSGNRNFEGRIHPLVRSSWLASPPLVITFALAGTTRINLDREPLGEDSQGHPVFLKDIWPSNEEIAAAESKVSKSLFEARYRDVFSGDEIWQQLDVPTGDTYAWDQQSTYIQQPPFFNDMQAEPSAVKNIEAARVLALLGDSVTTDHISPAGAIKPNSPAGKYLTEHGVSIKDFNSYGSRRGNHEVMMRGTFANIRIKNEMLDGVEGGYTLLQPSREQMSIYDAAMIYQKQDTPLVIIAGKEYGTGSSRDWAAKGTLLLGVKAVIAESFERIHRSNLIGMGVLPLEFVNSDTRHNLELDGSELISIRGLEQGIKPGMTLSLIIERNDGTVNEANVLCRIDTQDEAAYYQNGGILAYVLRNKGK